MAIPSADPTAVTITHPTNDTTTVAFTIGDALANHRIIRDQVVLTVLAPGVATFTDSTPDPGFAWAVQAYRSGQTGLRVAPGTTPPAPPLAQLSAPTWLAGYPFVPTNSTVISLQWADDPGAATQIEVSLDGTTWTVWQTTLAGARSATYRGGYATDYWFRLTAVNKPAYTNSTVSAVAHVFVPAYVGIGGGGGTPLR